MPRHDPATSAEPILEQAGDEPRARRLARLTLIRIEAANLRVKMAKLAAWYAEHCAEE